MSRILRGGCSAALIATVLAGAFAFARELAPGTASTDGNQGIAVDAVSRLGTVFRITGAVKGLFPGRRTRMNVMLRNPHPYPIVVKSVAAKVSKAARGCRGSNVAVRPFRGSRRVAANGRARIRLRVEMLRSAPDACRGARFPIRYTGKAVRP